MPKPNPKPKQGIQSMHPCKGCTHVILFDFGECPLRKMIEREGLVTHTLVHHDEGKFLSWPTQESEQLFLDSIKEESGRLGCQEQPLFQSLIGGYRQVVKTIAGTPNTKERL